MAENSAKVLYNLSHLPFDPGWTKILCFFLRAFFLGKTEKVSKQLQITKMSTPPKIAIVGAGPTGLTLARLLSISPVKLSVTLYERDVSPTARYDVGGTLDLHTNTGLAAIRKGGLFDTFLKHAYYDGDEKTIADNNATVLVHMRGGYDRPEIDRQKVKEVLVESVPAERVKWGRKLEEVRGERSFGLRKWGSGRAVRFGCWGGWWLE